MKLEWMRLRNFRQFYGDQTIRFSRDSSRNVTVVNGVNGAGKTSLFIALNWSLYGLGADNIGELVSKRAIDEATVGSDVDMQVQLSFWHSGERYTVTRAMCVTKTGRGSWQAKPQAEFSLDVIRATARLGPCRTPQAGSRLSFPRRCDLTFSLTENGLTSSLDLRMRARYRTQYATS